jgi:hypothetical protein
MSEAAAKEQPKPAPVKEQPKAVAAGPRGALIESRLQKSKK